MNGNLYERSYYMFQSHAFALRKSIYILVDYISFYQCLQLSSEDFSLLQQDWRQHVLCHNLYGNFYHKIDKTCLQIVSSDLNHISNMFESISASPEKSQSNNSVLFPQHSPCLAGFLQDILWKGVGTLGIGRSRLPWGNINHNLRLKGQVHDQSINQSDCFRQDKH